MRGRDRNPEWEQGSYSEREREGRPHGGERKDRERGEKGDGQTGKGVVGKKGRRQSRGGEWSETDGQEKQRTELV